MSNAAEKVTSIKEATRNIVQVYGKISAVRKATTKAKEKFFATLITLPGSGDEFSAPQTVEITSPEELGKAGEIVTVACQLGGYRRSYETRDDDGVISKHWTANMNLRAV